MTDTSLWHFIVHASPVVQCVMLLLIGTSVLSWTLIIQRIRFFKTYHQDTQTFDRQFWAASDLQQLFRNTTAQQPSNGMARIFMAGFDAFEQGSTTGSERIQRAMRIASAQATAELEKHLSFLATVGSTSPYIGLFGTVWGIMSAFRSLGTMGSATLSTVAPGIAEALIATAMGLFAAIPAVIAYNRFNQQAERCIDLQQTFQEELTSLFEHHHQHRPSA